MSYICQVQSGSFTNFWFVICHVFKNRPYAWRKELCLYMIERMLREDRCRIWSVSNKMGKLPTDENDDWNEPIDEIMRKLQYWWGEFEGQPISIHVPEGFDDLYFVDVIPPLCWPPYRPPVKVQK